MRKTGIGLPVLLPYSTGYICVRVVSCLFGCVYLGDGERKVFWYEVGCERVKVKGGG